MAIDFTNQKHSKGVTELRHREEEARLQELSQKIGIPYIDLSGIIIETDALKTIDEKEARELRLAGFKIVGKNLHIVAHEPTSKSTEQKMDALAAKGYNITLYLGSMGSLEKAWERYADISYASRSTGSFFDISQESLESIAEKVTTSDDIKAIFEATMQEETKHKISKLMEVIFGSAIAIKSSDVHIEPQDERVRLRLRLDGVLHDIVYFDHKTYAMIISRIKLLAQMKLTETQNAQDGRFTIEYKDLEIEIRVSVTPSSYGESIVMRILNPEGLTVGFDKLGIEPKLLKILKYEIAKPNGMILTTGPTGSGKTTTLYSFLKYIYTPEIKILTIEDPIEYHLEGITQTQVEHDKGYDFLAGLRAAMRQDPDVIMVGEIRDPETAGVAVNAALTGHLVLSTLHTNNAAGAIPRLLDLGVKPGILAPALSVAIAQRLVRRLCNDCKQTKTASEEEAGHIRKILDRATANGKDLSSYDIDVENDITLHTPGEGCEVCNGIGYKGRIGVYEAILSDDNIQALLEKHPSEREVKIKAQEQGILTMLEDSILKVLSGVTALEEIQKVVSLDEDDDLDGHKKSTKTPDKEPSQQENTEVKKPEKKITEDTSTKGTEISLLIGYLQDLEQDQLSDPSKSAEKKIAKIKDTIIEILEQAPIEELFAGTSANTQKEIDLLVQDLEALQKEQKNNPSKDIAEKLHTIRTTVENLSAQS